MRTLLHSLIITVMVIGGVGFIFQYFFYWTLRRHYASVWEQLGRPGLVSTLTSTRSVLSFLWHQKYRTVGDARLVRLASFFRSYLILYTVFFASILVAFVIYIAARP
jgi:hypothetical protein